MVGFLSDLVDGLPDPRVLGRTAGRHFEPTVGSYYWLWPRFGGDMQPGHGRGDGYWAGAGAAVTTLRLPVRPETGRASWSSRAVSVTMTSADGTVTELEGFDGDFSFTPANHERVPLGSVPIPTNTAGPTYEVQDFSVTCAVDWGPGGFDHLLDFLHGRGVFAPEYVALRVNCRPALAWPGNLPPYVEVTDEPN